MLDSTLVTTIRNCYDSIQFYGNESVDPRQGR